MDDPFPSLSSEGSDQNVDTDSLLPLVYADLRRIAAGMLAQERSGQTWQPTALVHEAYMRLWEASRLLNGPVEHISLERRRKRCGVC